MSKLYYVVYNNHKDGINYDVKSEEDLEKIKKSIISSVPCRYIHLNYKVMCERGRIEGSTDCLNCKYSRIGINPDHPLCLYKVEDDDE